MDRARQQWHQPLFNEIVILAAWNIWKQRNKHYFEKIIPSMLVWKKMLSDDLDILKLRVKPELA